MKSDHIRIRGARQNNLGGLDLDIPLGKLVVITGVSGSGKSSLAFDTVYSEGQRRYAETFSPYARQFLDRMDKPAVDRIEGIPPAIAIDQTNPVRTSRSTVGTMTEINDHLKLLFARAATLYCTGCGRHVQRDTPDGIFARLLHRAAGERAVISFRVRVPENFSAGEIRQLLERQGYTRITAGDGELEVVQDRLRLSEDRRDRIVEALETALRHGRGHVRVQVLDADRQPAAVHRFSSELHCPECNRHYHAPVPNSFSFNSPMGACETCRGFGRIMGIDYGLVIPDPNRSLAEGAIRPWQSGQSVEHQRDLIRHAGQRGVPTDVPWKDLEDADRQWVIEGEGRRKAGRWYGVRGYFDWLESKAYRMHVRVLLSRYRSYDLCPDCRGARLKPEALAWRLGSKENADSVLAPAARFRPHDAELPEQRLATLPGLHLHDVMGLPIERAHRFFTDIRLPAPMDEAAALLLQELRSRLGYLTAVGLGYLTLDRQSRTLSGGEVQRINLTTALGTSLVNTLFVLDEPSIGLHPRDMQRIVDVMHRLRDAGNSLLVVEHDPQVMAAADRVIDIGPGPGERGGRIVFEGTYDALLDAPGSLTADYLAGRRHVVEQSSRRPPPEHADDWLTVTGAAAHNLKAIDVRLPLNRLTVLTGVSGSGKSTLMGEVLHNGLRKLKGRPTDPPGQYRAMLGHERIDGVVLVDQSPIGRTTRSNPASYVGAFDAIRNAFVAEPLAKQRGYTRGTFSFNTGQGRCPTCGGNGFEHVEMQFLSDVYLRCPDCDGRRYRDEILEVVLPPSRGCDARPRSIAEVLDLTVTEAIAFFADLPDVLRALEPLAGVGLGYMTLGQPVPTLSGGEAQRLKLAGHLAGVATRKKRDERLLFLFDEPTTGLHFDDVAVLLRAFRRLLDADHSLLVIEHNLDVIRAADWIVDLGPEGGDGGGELVAEGTPEAVMAVQASHTGRALRDYVGLGQPARDGGRTTKGGNAGAPMWERRPRRDSRSQDDPVTARTDAGLQYIEVHRAREHNLKSIDVRIPRDRLTVITGISGSGKSTLAFDILFNEGQRRYLESLNAYARQFVQPAARPDVDAIFGIPPTVAIEQRTSRGGRKSTVATMTEIHHFLRLLLVKLGTQHCPRCQIPIEAQTAEAILARVMRSYRGHSIRLLAPLVTARKGYYTDLAKWAAGKGFHQLRVDGTDTPTAAWPRLDRYQEHDIDLPVATLCVEPGHEDRLREALHRTLGYGKGTVKVEHGRTDTLFSSTRACPGCGRSFEALDPRQFSYNSRHGWCTTCFGTGRVLPGFGIEQTGEESAWIGGDEAEPAVCPDCDGQRLNPEALAVRFHDRNIAAFASESVDQSAATFARLNPRGREAEIARDILPEIANRLAFLSEVGLGYLTLDRAAPTLSGGEAQRIRLAAQLGSNLRGVCYIMDEPTIGLHPRDNRMLLDTLGRLEGKGNTIVVVEHDEDTIRRAEHVVDLGPGAGTLGGRVVATGNIADLLANPDSVTGRCLADPLRHPLREHRRAAPAEGRIRIAGAHLHNLKYVDADFPLGRLVCVSGVSGSGKSTLVRDVLHGNLKRLLAARRGDPRPTLRGCEALEGWGEVDRVLEVDQTPIGKTPRSCPATYVGFWNDIRKLFAQTEEARIRGYDPGRFSFNTRDGRCPGCDGQGVKRIEMSFLPDVTLACDLCHGMRFTPETLAVRWRGRSIGDVLGMSVDEAVDFFEVHPRVHHALRLLQDTGLGYLTLGQQSPTLSGGEAQRIKLVTELAKARPDTGRRKPPHTLYVLDEPTVGLHMADVEKLIRVLHRLVDAGNTVVVIEHNLDIIAEADRLMDLGPEGGDGGGVIIAAGTPEEVAESARSHTGHVLATFLADRGQPTARIATADG